MKKGYLIDKSKCDCNVKEFFDNAAKIMGVTVTDKTRYDCRKICVSKLVLDRIWQHYSKRRGYRNYEITSLLLQYGPKATLKRDAYCFEVEDGFIVDEEE